MATFIESLQLKLVESIKSDSFQNQLWQALFPTVSIDDAAQIDVHTFLEKTAPALQIFHQGENPPNRVISAGDVETFIPPTYAQEVSVDRAFRDKAQEGAGKGYAASRTRLMYKIMDGPTGFIQQIINTFNKKGLDVFVDGTFNLGNKVHDFGRDEANEFVSNAKAFAKSKGFDAAVKDMWEATQKKGAPYGGFVLMCGSDWLDWFDADATVQKKREAQQVTAYNNAVPNAGFLSRIEGVYPIALYRVDGIAVPIYIAAYSPKQRYKPLAHEDKTDLYLPKDKAVLINFEVGGFRFFRGVDVATQNGQTSRISGIVMDSYADERRLVDFYRVQSRVFFYPANINTSAVAKLK